MREDRRDEMSRAVERMKHMKRADVLRKYEDKHPSVPLAEIVTTHADGSCSKRYMKFTTIGALMDQYPKRKDRDE